MDNKLYKITVEANSNPMEYRFSAVVSGVDNGNPKEFHGNSLKPIFAKIAAYIEEAYYA